MMKIKARSDVSSSSSVTTARSLPCNLTGREVQILLKTALNEKTNVCQGKETNLHLMTSNPKLSQKESKVTLRNTKPNADRKCDQTENKYVALIEEDAEVTKSMICSVLMDLVFEEFDLNDVVEYVGKPLDTNVDKVFIFDERATKSLDEKADCKDSNNNNDSNLIKTKISRKETFNRQPPPLPAKPNHLPTARQQETFPIRKTCSYVESSHNGRPPTLPKRNDSTPPIPPIRTTSMANPSPTTRIQLIHGDMVRAVEQVIKSVEQLNSSSSSSLKGDSDGMLIYKKNTKVLDQCPDKIATNISSIFNSSGTIQAFSIDDVPYADDPDSLDYTVELSDENLSMAENEVSEEVATPITYKIYRKLPCQFNSLPKISTKAKFRPNRTVSRSYQDLDNDVRNDHLCNSDKDEETSHYEEISHLEDPQEVNDKSVFNFQNKTVILKKNELVVVEPKCLDFQISSSRKREKLKSNRLLQTLSHQYERLEESGDVKQSKRHEKSLTTAYDRKGHMYFIPKFALKDYSDPSEEIWFYPIPLTTLQATCFLRNINQFGSFVIYRSTECTGVYYLSVCVPDDVIHYRIEQDTFQNVGIIGSTRKFPSLRDLVNFYRGNRGSLLTRLKRSMKDIDLPIVPGYHYDMKYEIDRKEVQFSNELLGVGHFGTICLGTVRNQKVAIEVLEASNETDENMKDKDDGFIEMASIFVTLDHQNIIKFVGLSCHKAPYFFITEHSGLGTLKSFLKSKSTTGIDNSSMIDMCCQMSSALSYLASKLYVIHRNVTCKSFLLFEGMQVKLSEFHKARYVVDDLYITSPSDPICVKWASPEVLVNQVYTTKSDVWALAVSIWEVFMIGENPFPSLNIENAARCILEGIMLSKPNECPEEIYNLMMQCWRISPLDRPHIRQIKRTLMTYKMHFYEELKDQMSSEGTSELQVNNIPQHEAPTVGIVKLRKKFFTQKSKEGQTESVRSTKKTESMFILDSQKGEDIVDSAGNSQAVQKKGKKSRVSRLFDRASLSDLTFKFKHNETSKVSVRSEHSKSFQADSINHFDGVSKTHDRVFN